MEVFRFIEILGVIAFATSGVFAAVEKKFDLFGIFIIAFITAMGGGTLRDILIGNLPVTWMVHPEYGLIIFITAAVALLFANRIKNFRTALLFFDAVGLGFFTILGLQKGVHIGLHAGVCIALGTITACFGGVIRDILLNTTPILFHKEMIYATASILGGVLYFILQKTNLSALAEDLICIVVIVVIRLLSVRYNWRLPNIYSK